MEVSEMSSGEVTGVLIVLLVMSAGYVANLNKFIKQSTLSNLAVARAIGLAIFPLGFVLGVFY